MAIALNSVRGGFELVALVEDLVTLRTKACVRIFVTCDPFGPDKRTTLYERFCLMEVPE